MAESEAIQTAVMQAAIQPSTVAVMALREADSGPTSGTSTKNIEEACRQRSGRPA